jgi:predicted ATPase
VLVQTPKAVYSNNAKLFYRDEAAMLKNRINRIEVKNYRSLGDVAVDLEDLTVLVGPNGSGKSNFLDVLRFVRDALVLGLDAALINHERGGIGRLRRYSFKGRPYDVVVRLHLTIEGQKCEYNFTLGSETRNQYTVKSEHCLIGENGYERGKDYVRTSLPGITPLVQERNLFLPLINNYPPFDGLYAFLAKMGFYSIYPNNLRGPQRPGNLYPLEEDGKNLATFLRELINRGNEAWQSEFYSSLAQLVLGILPKNSISVDQVSGFLVIRIKHEGGAIFDLNLESDGTIRLLGLLAAIYQTPPLSLLSIEEPELFIHDRAMAILRDILLEASVRSQVLLTTHNSFLIGKFPPESLRIVKKIEGNSRIGPIANNQLSVIRQQLFNAGELLHIEDLEGDYEEQ